MATLRNVFKRLIWGEEGAALVEYGLLVGLIAVVCVIAVAELGTKVRSVFQSINTSLTAQGL